MTRTCAHFQNALRYPLLHAIFLLVTTTASGLVVGNLADARPQVAAAKRPETPREHFDALVAHYEEHVRSYHEELSRLENHEDIQQEYPKPDETAGALLALGREFPDEIGLEAIEWILASGVQGEISRGAILLCSEEFLHDPRVADALWEFAYQPGPEVEALLQRVIGEHPEKSTRGIARYVLARYLMARCELASALAGAEPEEREEWIEFIGEESATLLRETDVPKLEARALALLERVQAEHADVPAPRKQTLGDVAERESFKLRFLGIGKTAPEIEGEDLFGESFRLSDSRGKVVLLSFWGDW